MGYSVVSVGYGFLLTTLVVSSTGTTLVVIN